MTRAARTLAVLREIMQRHPDAMWVAPDDAAEQRALADASQLAKLFTGRPLEVRAD